MSGISAHMIVKNEDRWVWYSINSILPFVDELLITDTGSTDHTLELISRITSPKITLTKLVAETAAQVTLARQAQLKHSRYPWIWTVDADEIYPHQTAKECLSLTRSSKYLGVLVRRHDLLGDIYHCQSESVGTYRLFGHTGHLLVRLINRDLIKGLNYQGDYPNEGYFDGSGHSILSTDKSKWALTSNYLYHAMYLRRSSLGHNLPMFNRGKYKIERGHLITDSIPEVFAERDPLGITDPTAHTSLAYNLVANLVTPIKQLKRRFL